MKIVSRLSEEETQLQRLRDIVEVATGGAISEDGELEPAHDLSGLVTQVDITCASLLEALDHLEQQIDRGAEENARLADHLVGLEIQLQTFTDIVEDGVPYDEDLEHATIDFMEAFMATGAAEPTFDGEISILGTITITKEDLKPIVRQAIDSWLTLKASDR